jgi:hypothetical protein
VLVNVVLDNTKTWQQILVRKLVQYFITELKLLNNVCQLARLTKPALEHVLVIVKHAFTTTPKVA